MTDQNVQQVLQRTTPTVNGHTAPAGAPKAAAEAPKPAVPAKQRRPRVIAVVALLLAGLVGFGVWHVFFAAHYHRSSHQNLP